MDFFVSRWRFFLPYLLAAACLQAAPAAAQQVMVVTGEQCPPNTTAVTYQEATANQQEYCHLLGTWFIARLAGGGSIDGPGYECRMRTPDTRPLGHSLCKVAASTGGELTLTGCAAPGVESGCVTMTADGTKYNISGAEPPPAWDHWLTVRGRVDTGGAGFCEGTRLQISSWQYANRTDACPARGFSIHDPGPPYNP